MEQFEELDFELFKIKQYGEDLTEKINLLIKHIKSRKEFSGIYNNMQYSIENNDIKILYMSNIYYIIKFPIKVEIENNQKSFYLYSYKTLYEDIKKLFSKYLIFYKDEDKPEDNLEQLYLKLKNYDEKINENERILKIKAKFEVSPKFASLCNRINKKQLKQQICFKIDYNILTPFFKEIFNFSTDDECFEFIADDNRKKLFEYFKKFEKSENLKVLKIYGNEGIGKTISFLYYISVENSKHFLYFNLKLLFQKKEESDYSTIKIKKYDYFKLELMRYFVSQYNINDEDNKKEIMEFLFKHFLKFLSKFEKENREDILKFNFWNLMIYLINNLKNCIFILDQFKCEMNQLKALSEIIYLIKHSYNSKVIILSSINNSGVKAKLANELSIHCESIYPLFIDFNNENEYIKNIIKKYETTVFEDDKEKEEFEKDEYDEKELKEKNEIIDIDEKFYNDYYRNFLKISIFNFNNVDTTKINQKEIKSQEINDDDNINNDFYNNLLKNQKKYISQSKNKVIDKEKEQILYINKLVNIQELVKNAPKELKRCMEYFNYLPKYYNKFIDTEKKLKIRNQSIEYNKIIQIFYDEMKNNIIKKIHQNYKNLNKSDYREDLIYEYKSLFKLSLNITNQKSFHLKKLIKYINQYPIKFLKIQIIFSPNQNVYKKKSNFIEINKGFHGEIFSLDYSYPFVEYVIKDYINKAFNQDKLYKIGLTGSSFVHYFKKEFEYLLIDKNKFNIKPQKRYVWTLEKLSEFNLKNIKEQYCHKYDDLSFLKEEKIDNIIPECLNANNNYYYISPNKQTNKYFDSALINVHNNKEKDCSLILFQFTKNKESENIYTKEEYKIEAVNKIKPKLESIYNINIINIHFFYILYIEDKKVENLVTNLEKKSISYFFISLEDYEFYKENNKYIKLTDFPVSNETKIFKTKIFNIVKKDPNVKFLNKKYKFIRFEMHYNVNKIDPKKNSYLIFEEKRRNYFKNDNISLAIEDQYYSKIINFIKKNLSSGYYTFIYCFKLEIKYFYQVISDDDYFGIFLYNKKLYCFHKKNITCLTEDSDTNEKNKILLYLIYHEDEKGEKIKKEMLIKENIKALSKKIIGLNSLINNNINSYSFIFKIYKINKNMYFDN